LKEKVKTPVDRDKIELPPYLPNHPAIIEEYANHLDAIQITDEKVRDILEKLKKMAYSTIPLYSSFQIMDSASPSINNFFMKEVFMFL